MCVAINRLLLATVIYRIIFEFNENFPVATLKIMLHYTNNILHNNTKQAFNILNIQQLNTLHFYMYVCIYQIYVAKIRIFYYKH